MKISTNLVTLLVCGLLATTLAAQDEKAKQEEPNVDPASASEMFLKTIGKIRNVEQLEKFIKENQALKEQNKTLKSQVNGLNGKVNTLTQQVNKLTQELNGQKERIRKQLLELPSFSVKSKLVRGDDSIAILQFGEKAIRIRNKVEMSVPVKDGVWINMQVVKIDREIIELKFPELDRTLLIYD